MPENFLVLWMRTILVPFFLLLNCFSSSLRKDDRVELLGFQLWSRHSSGSCVCQREKKFVSLLSWIGSFLNYQEKFSELPRGSLLDLTVDAFLIISELSSGVTLSCLISELSSGVGRRPLSYPERKRHPSRLFQLRRIQIAP